MHPHYESQCTRTVRAPRRPLLYLAEDDDPIRELLTALFVRDGFEVRAAATGTQLFDWLFHQRGPGLRIPDLIVTDHRLPGYTALDVLDGLFQFEWSIPVIVITAYGYEVREQARAHGAVAVFDKPIPAQALREEAQRCIPRPPYN